MRGIWYVLLSNWDFSGGLLDLTIFDVYGIPILLSTPVCSLISHELLNGLLLPFRDTNMTNNSAKNRTFEYYLSLGASFLKN